VETNATGRDNRMAIDKARDRARDRNPVEARSSTRSTSSLPTRERQRLETRRQILEVALEEIAEVGLAKARIEHIAQRAGVTRPTIYAHFPTKEDFLRALQANTERAAQSMLEALTGEAGGAELMHRVVDTIFDLVESSSPNLRRETFALLIREPHDTDWPENDFYQALANHFEQAQRDGSIRADLPSMELASIAMTALFGFIAVETQAFDTRRAAAHQMLDQLLAPEQR
jgi:AcrR family transcriptional regulator